jgi:hypothetical protein
MAGLARQAAQSRRRDATLPAALAGPANGRDRRGHDPGKIDGRKRLTGNRRPSAEEPLDRLQKVGDRDRLGDIGFAAALEDLLLIALHGEGGHGDDGD